MASGAALVTRYADTYTRADSLTDLGSTETGSQAYVQVVGVDGGISTNRGVFNNSATGGLWSLNTGGFTDGEFSLDVNRGTTGGFPIMAIRLVDDNNMIGLQWDTGLDKLKLTKIVASTQTDLGTISGVVMSASTTYTVKVTAVGNTISAYLNGSLICGPVTDAAFNSATKIGLRRYGGGLEFTWDNLLYQA